MEDSAHPSFPQPANPDATLWRYMDAWKFEWLLEHQRLYLPTADQLGDHLEGTTPQAEVDRFDAMIAAAETDEEREVLLHNRRFYAGMSAKMRTGYYVSCWNMNDYESSLMWAAYTSAREAEAVAIRTSFSALRSVLPAFVSLGVVRYIDFDTARFRGEVPNMLEWIMHKEAIYRDEAEVRAVAMRPVHEELGGREFEGNLFEREDQTGALVYAPKIGLAQLIQAVVVHPKATPAYLQKVGAQCEAHQLPPPSRSRGARVATF